MVSVTEERREAERRLVLSYAPARARAGMGALLALDATLGQILRTTREPLVGQMRLTWWHEALSALDRADAPAEPVLRALAADVLPSGVTGAELAATAEGWEALFDPLDGPSLERAAAARGGVLFAAAARVLGGDDERIAALGQGWALADFAGGLSDRALAGTVGDAALAMLDAALAKRWPARLRVLSALALAAGMDVARPDDPPAGPRRVWRLMRHRIGGR